MARRQVTTASLLEQTIPSLVNGVSRQTVQTRRDSQCEEQVNIVSNVASGLIRRPPTEHIAELTGGGFPLPSPDGAHFSLINRGDDQKYLVVIAEGDLNVYDVADGSEVTVNIAPGTNMAVALDDDSGNNLKAQDYFETVTVADYTFVVNKTKVLEATGNTDNPRTREHEFLLSAKDAGVTSNYYNDLTMTIGTAYATSSKPNNTNPDGLIDEVCQKITGTLNPVDTVGFTTGAGGRDPGAGEFGDWRFTRLAPTVLYAYQFQNLGVKYEIETEDDFGNTLHELLSTTVDGATPTILKFSDVPVEAPADFTIEVAGDEGNTADSFYVKYEEDRRTWVETVKPGINSTLDTATFPHVLIFNQSTGQFSFEVGPWGPRLVGDDVSAPMPTGLGNVASDLFIHEGRLAILTGENVLMSEAGDYFNFFPTTVTTIVDSDALDVAGTGSRVALWDYAVPARRQVLLFSSIGDVVAVLTGGRDDRLSVKNARIQVLGTWAHSKLRPQTLGGTVYYSHDKGGSSAVHEMREVEVELWNSDETTAHVPGYLPSGLYDAKATQAEQMIVYRSPNESNVLYVYAAETIGGQQAVSSWSQWTFGEDANILAADWIESTLYLVLQRADGVYLEKMDFGKLDEDEGAGPNPLGHRVHLDSVVARSGSYSVNLDRTIWTAPYDTTIGTVRIVRGGEWDDSSGVTIPVMSTSGNTVTARGDWSDHPVYIGREYTSTYRMSQIVRRDSDGVGELAGRLQLRKGRVVYTKTGAFDVIITSESDDMVSTVPFTSVLVGGSLLGAVELTDGIFPFHIGGHNEDVRVTFQSSSFLPFQLSSVNWEGRFYKTAQ